MSKEEKGGSPLSRRAQEIIDLALSLNKARNMDEILLDLVKQVAEVTQAEAATIFAIDPAGGELYSKVKVNGDIKEIRVPISRNSVAGYAAETGQVVNLADAYDPTELQRYKDLKFDNTWDRMSGFRTRSMLCVPLRFKDTGLQGVIQLINHTRARTFSATAESLLATVARAVAVAFFNQGRMNREPTRFDLLLAREVITEDQLRQAQILAARHKDHPIKGDLVSILLKEFAVPRAIMAKSLSQYFQVDVFEFRENTSVIYDLLESLVIPPKYLSNNHWVPIRRDSRTMTVVTDDPKDVRKVNEIIEDLNRRGFDGQVRFMVGFREDIKKFLDPDYVPDHEVTVRQQDPEDDPNIEVDENAPTIVKLVNDLIRQAFDGGISDIHIEPYPGRQPTTVRFRQDGLCSKHSEIRRQYSRGVINRFKIMANLKLDERRMPQSGKIKLKYHERDVELRLEVTPTVGDLEDLVLRILTSSKPLKLEALNFSEANYRSIMEIVNKPYGIILCVGPTGSGKTTTLHSILGYLNSPDKKIWTVEDPVEITQRGLRQVQVNPNIKPRPYDFAMAMRSFLRADPDIIMVGEMRDRETAAIAIEASLTGHLVLSTLHTNSAPETVTRIVEMGLDPINVSDATLGILAQRLVRTLCEHCKQEYEPQEGELNDLRQEYGTEYAGELGLDGGRVRLFKAAGCAKCGDTGYRGRAGIHELLMGSPLIKKLIRDHAPAAVIRQAALGEGMRTLKMDGIGKVLQGQSDLAQVLKVCID